MCFTTSMETGMMGSGNMTLETGKGYITTRLEVDMRVNGSATKSMAKEPFILVKVDATLGSGTMAKRPEKVCCIIQTELLKYNVIESYVFFQIWETPIKLKGLCLSIFF